MVFSLFSLMISCEKKENLSTFSSQIDNNQASQNGSNAGSSGQAVNYGYTLRVNTSFYTLEKDTGAESDKTKWNDSIPLGEKVVINKPRRATFAGDGVVYDFVEIRRDSGKEGFVFATQLSEGGSLAVVIDEKANIYKTPKNIDVTGTILSRKTVIAYVPDSERDGFVEFKAYDPAAQTTFRNSYIKLSSVSLTASDVQSSILLQAASALKNEGSEKIRKDALLKAALDEYPDSAFSADIRSLAGLDPASARIPVQPSSANSLIVIDNNVNVRSAPDTNSSVIGQLGEDTEVTVSEETVQAYTVSDSTDKWYHITDPVDGWVFGAFLE
jgi:uncharacterized protein YgiM (DUF1202 family)